MLDNIFPALHNNNPVLIAEMGVNYYDIAKKLNISPMEAAKLMICQAKLAGIHAVKFQSYKANTLAAKISPSYWDLNENPVTSQRELFSFFDSFGEREYKELAQYAENIGIEFFSTAFDYESADYLEPLMNLYKISSSDLSNLPFIEYQARKGKPIMLSIGASFEDEIELAVKTILKVNSCPLMLFHCVLEYPTPIQEANLAKIVTLKKKYPNCIIGYSDHTKPTNDAVVTNTAFVLGAHIIEKHFTLDKSLKGNDHFHAMDPADARNILDGMHKIKMIYGNGTLVCLPGEQTSRINARRSLVSKIDIKQGTIISEDMLICKRPGTGISPDKINDVIGRRTKKNIKADVVLTSDMIE